MQPVWQEAAAAGRHVSPRVWRSLLGLYCLQGQEVKRPWKPHYHKHKGPLEPDRTTLLMAVARELLTTWEITRDKDNVARHLAAVDKIYGTGSESLVRTYMHMVKKNERCG